MRVLFLNPPFHPRFSREQRSPAVTKSGTLYYPKWLATAAGVAIRSGHAVDLVDAPAASLSVGAVIDRIQAKNIDAVVCDTSTPSILNDVSVIEALMSAKPSLSVLMWTPRFVTSARNARTLGRAGSSSNSRIRVHGSRLAGGKSVWGGFVRRRRSGVAQNFQRDHR